MRVLMVEDSRYMAEAVAQVLRRNNYTVDLKFDGESGLDYGLCGIYDIIILDIMLPRMDGMRVLKELRRNGVDTPVILLTARGEMEDKVRGLDNGADDYLAKPFHTEELLARLRALGRRKAELVNDGVLKFGDLDFSPMTLRVTCGGKETKLALKESQILELLVNSKGRVVSKETIMEKVWGFDPDAEDSRAETHVCLLRRKLQNVGSGVAIRTVRGVGYALRRTDGGK